MILRLCILNLLLVQSFTLPAQEYSEKMVQELIQDIAASLKEIDKCSYQAILKTRVFGSDTFDMRTFDVSYKLNPTNAQYGYDWQISEARKTGFTLTFMALENSLLTIHESAKVINYRSLPHKLSPGEYVWTLHNYFMIDEVLDPFIRVATSEIRAVDSADLIILELKMHENAIRKLVIDKESYLPKKSTSIIKNREFEFVQIIEAGFSDYVLELGAYDFQPEHYLTIGYDYNIVESEDRYLPSPMYQMNMNATDTLLSYPFLSEKNDTVFLSQSSGKYTLMDFWFASCTPCLKSMPEIDRLSRAYESQGLEVYGVNCFDTNLRRNLVSKIRDKGISVPLLFGSRSLCDALNIVSFPTYLILDPQGKIEVIEGGLPAVEKMLKKVFD